MTSKTRSADNRPLKIVMVGHVDHGKSTLVGRVLYDTGSLPDGKYESIVEMCKRRGMPFEWAFLMDALQAERDQGITIDTTQIWFHTAFRDYVLIDAPGHKEFLKNMITGAAASDAAVLVIDADEGVQEQSRRHGYLVHLMGVKQVAVAVNKMDLVGHSEARFKEVKKEYRAYLKSIGVDTTQFVPVSARDGDNVSARSENMSWYSGPTIVDVLDGFESVTAPVNQPLRFPVQDVYKFDDRRIIAGRIEAGSLMVGDELLFSPSNKKARVRTIESWNTGALPQKVRAGESVGITLDEQLFIERGHLASHVGNPPTETDVFLARVFWLGRRPLRVGARYKLKLNTTELPVEVQEIRHIIDTGDLSEVNADQVERNAVAELVLRTDDIVALDDFGELSRTGRFVLVDGYDIAGGGIISMEGYADQRQLITVESTNIQRVDHVVTDEIRAARNGHCGGVLWFTGLSGAGKSTLAVEVERQLFEKGYQVYVLDGDNVRHGLNANLGFSPEDRAENIRRVGEVASLFARAGIIVITAFISPYRSDRDRARVAAGNDFHEIYIKADVEACERRDPKGLYKKARAGQIKNFTGISAPYEPPANAELDVDTSNADVETCVTQIIGYIENNFALGTGRLVSGAGS